MNLSKKVKLNLSLGILETYPGLPSLTGIDYVVHAAATKIVSSSEYNP